MKIVEEQGGSQKAGPGPGSGYYYYYFFVVILLYCYFQMFGIFLSFMVEISKKKKKNTRKLRKGHFSD